MRFFGKSAIFYQPERTPAKLTELFFRSCRNFSGGPRAGFGSAEKNLLRSSAGFLPTARFFFCSSQETCQPNAPNSFAHCHTNSGPSWAEKLRNDQKNSSELFFQFGGSSLAEHFAGFPKRERESIKVLEAHGAYGALMSTSGTCLI